MVTIKDIAEELGLSISTVGRALADHPRIGAQTKLRVRAAAERLHYIADAPARLMRGHPSTLVGLLIPDIQNDFYSVVAKHMSECCDNAGYQLVLSITGDNPDIEMRQVCSLISARGAGLVIVPTAQFRSATAGFLERIPHVQLIREHPAIESDWFGIDDTMAMGEAADHLLALGHRRIGYIGSSLELSTGQSRLAGVRAAFERAGADPRGILVDAGAPTAEFARQALRRLLAMSPLPTAVIVGGARLTLGAIEEIDAMGISVPAQLSLIGFGDTPWFRFWGAGLTVIDLPVAEISTACGAALLQRIGKRAPESSMRRTYAATLVLRGSTRQPT